MELLGGFFVMIMSDMLCGIAILCFWCRIFAILYYLPLMRFFTSMVFMDHQIQEY
jgi:hypothetical protein